MNEREYKPFIPAWLDNAGLTPSQFRVMCHISRRGLCWDSLDTMESVCKMRRRTIQIALKELLAMKRIHSASRVGQSSIYSLEPITKQALGSNGTHPKRGTTGGYETGTGGQDERGTTHLLRNRHYKGNPSEGYPNKGKPNKGVSVFLKSESIDPSKT